MTERIDLDDHRTDQANSPVAPRRGRGSLRMRGRHLALAALLALGVPLALAGCSDLDEGRSGARAPAAPASVLAREQVQNQRLDLSGIGHDLGSPDAPIKIIEFSDFGCPFCAQFAKISLPELHEEFIATGMVQWKYIPYILGIFPNGDRAALAGECAAEQGDDTFWSMHDKLYENQQEWKSEGRGARDLFARYATELELDREAFLSCYDEERPGKELNRIGQLGQQFGVRATPTFFINGERVEGAIPLELFRQAIREVAAR